MHKLRLDIWVYFGFTKYMASSLTICSYCKSEFLKENKYINETRKFGYNSYCSKKCRDLSKNKQVELICDNRRRRCLSIDGHLCDSISELLIDNWLYKNKINHKKATPYPKGRFVADWSLSPKILMEYFGLANDSRRYDIAVQRKRNICSEFGIELIEIHSRDLFPENKLEKILSLIPRFSNPSTELQSYPIPVSNP